VKIKFQANKEALEKNKLEGLGKDEKRKFIEKTITSLRQTNELKLKQLKEQEDDYRKNIQALEDEICALGQERDKLLSSTKTHQTLREKYAKLIKLKTQIEINQKNHQEKVDFYHDNDSCPTCKQNIDADFRAIEIGNITTKLKDYKDGIDKISEQLNSILTEIDAVDVIVKQVENIRNDISFKDSRLSFLRESLASVEKLSVVSDTTLLESEQELVEITALIDQLTLEKDTLITDKLYIDTATQLLKDGGIKTKIIKQYLPLINKHINKYLLQMGFFVNFNINENFEETIKSRYRDEFSYQNFSEGEKMRIDLALLFTWRAIAKMKNSVNTNLLILDEIFDGSLDTNGTDEFLKIMSNMLDNTNVFVISHKTDQLVDKFKKTYRFQKIKNFSVLTK
jgi:DNA repair exonuclease SbcCD ATPase subunit